MTDAPPLNRRDPYAVLRNRNVLFFLLGRVIASLGQQMVAVAVGWDIYERTHSAWCLGLVGLCGFLPMVVMTLPAGHVADTRERKQVILAMQVLMALASLGLALNAYWKGPAAIIYVCLLVASTARTFLWSATASFLPTLVSREDFPQAITWATSSFQFAATTGPAARGLLIAITGSATPVYVFNTVAAVVYFILITFVRGQTKPAASHEFTLETILGGFRYVFNSPLILAAITLDMFAVLFGGATALLPAYASDILHVGPQGLGFLRAALPVGSLCCALYMAHRAPLQKAGRTLLWAVVVFGVATVGFGWSKSFWFSLVMLFICGFADNISVIVRHTLVQLLTPDEMRGRVSAVNNLFIGTSNELGEFESGAVSGMAARHYGVIGGNVFSVVSGGVATVLVVAGVAWYWPEMRRFGALVQAERQAKS